MSRRPPHEWRERWQPFAIALSFIIGFLVVSELILVAMELKRLSP